MVVVQAALVHSYSLSYLLSIFFLVVSFSLSFFFFYSDPNYFLNPSHDSHAAAAAAVERNHDESCDQ